LKSHESEEICDFGGFLKSRLCNGVQRNDAKTGKIALNSQEPKRPLRAAQLKSPVFS
jgi:hypothetical protein